MRKVLQSYFTELLFIKTISHNTQLVMNDILQYGSFLMWKFILETFINPNITSEAVSQEVRHNEISNRWTNEFRVFLKGGKAIQHLIQNRRLYSLAADQQIAAIFYHTFARNCTDSDFDFTFLYNAAGVSKPLGKNNIDAKLHKCIKYVTQECNKLVNTQDSWFKNQVLEKVCNDPHHLRHKLAPMLEPFLSRAPTLQPLYDMALSGQPLFTLPTTSPLFISKRSMISREIDPFFLYRMIIHIPFIDESFNSLCTDLHMTQFAECIDVSYQYGNVDALWNKTSLEQAILRPLAYLDFFPDYFKTFNGTKHVLLPIISAATYEDKSLFREINARFAYPVANLSYQFADTLIMIQEDNVSKLGKRCKRFIEYIYMMCMEEKLSRIPSQIFLSTDTFARMQQESECQDFLSKIGTIHQHDDRTVVLDVKPELQQVNTFESWCRQQLYHNITLAWESSCTQESSWSLANKLVASAERLLEITQQAYIFNIDDWTSHSKKFICEMYNNLILLESVLSCIDAFFTHAYEHVLGRCSHPTSFENNDRTTLHSYHEQDQTLMMQMIKTLVDAMHDTVNQRNEMRRPNALTNHYISLIQSRFPAPVAGSFVRIMQAIVKAKEISRA
jgi:hypothetical protein